jgi:hypothetical protein
VQLEINIVCGEHYRSEPLSRKSSTRAAFHLFEACPSQITIGVWGDCDVIGKQRGVREQGWDGLNIQRKVVQPVQPSLGRRYKFKASPHI